MLTPRSRGALYLFALAIAASCGGNSEPTGTTTTPSGVAIVSGNGQVGLVGQTLSNPLVVRVLAGNNPVTGAVVSFAVTSGAASVSPTTATTDIDGQAKALVTLGASPGNVTITATVTGTGLTANFVVTAGAPNIVASCTTKSPITPSLGVTPDLTGTGVCLSGGTTGAEYALIAFNSNPDTLTGTNLPLSVFAKGANAVASASVAPNYNVAAVPGSPLTRGAPNDIQSSFDARLRETARRELAPMVPAALARLRQSAALSAIPANPTVGSLVTLNANGVQACSAAKNRVSRVAAVTASTIVVADTANPAGGFTDAEYQSFATTFDTLISPLDVANFGQPTDIDKNGKIVIFFTKEVNLLTPRGSGGVVGGFFFERDLFPLSNTADFGACAGSNFAEMFYVLVPDPNAVYGDARSKQKVLDVTPGTLAHEYQHLINAGRRMYINLPFNDFEEVWLNEGLSHVAEELLYYRIAGLTPRQNITSSKLGASQASVDAFNKYQGDNNGRFEIFIGMPSKTSVYGNNDSLETRGATWNLLRYLADHRGTSDGDSWQLLVNTSLIGQTNLAHVFGVNYMSQIRDWATSIFADDLVGVTDPRWLQPSWNMRDIFPKLVDNNNKPLGRYPLSVVPLSDAVPANLAIYSGGEAYLRFSVPAGSQASIDWQANGLPVSPLIQFTLVRTK